MAHFAGDPLLGQTAREVPDATDNNETDHTLREFWKATATLRNVLDQERSLNDQELLLLEYHFHILRMAYLRLKPKQRRLSAESAGSPPLNHDARRGLILPR
jgi:hypothetical protein